METTKASMRLQTRVSATLLAVFAVFGVLTWFILQAVVQPAFDELELAAATRDLVRAEGALRTDIENLEAITADWAFWDDIYGYVRGENPGFRRSNLDRPTLTNLGLDFMAVFATRGELVWSQGLLDGRAIPTRDLAILEPGHESAPLLVEHDSPASRTVGIVETPLGPAIISSRPILRSDESGPVAGALVMGQFLDDRRLQRFRERTEVAVSWLFANDAEGAAAVTELGASYEGIPHTSVSDTVVSSFKAVEDINGRPFLLLKTDTPRAISALGDRSVYASMVFLGAVGVLATIVIWFTLKSTVLQPLGLLAKHIDDMRKSGDLTHRADIDSDSEIGVLARQFDDLTGEVHRARRALLDQSFKAGKADTAAEILHNIRNALTPLINGLERLGKSRGNVARLHVDEALEQLADPDCPAERRDKLLQYLSASFRRVEEAGGDSAEDLDIVTAQARQVEAILANQEKFTNAAPLEEKLAIADVIREAAHVIPRDVEPPVGLELDGTLGNYSVRGQRIGLLQVFGNLILNAAESIARQRREDGEIRIRASDELVDDKPMVRLTIEDNGRGFDPETSRKIFQRGFTSKAKGDINGLGLHWCANAVRGMGGSIAAESAGEGRGAEFHVLLPAAQGG